VEPARTAGGDLRFGVDARHVRQLGQELVGDRVTAVSELIKNGYDADATFVRLRFQDAAAAGGVLEIQDDGNGMTLEDLEQAWMRISTARKESEAISPRFGRTRAGRKGIGRFATETLGRKLVLRTKTAGAAARLVVEFDWERDYPAGTELTEIANPYFLEAAPEDDHGTTLRIEGLYDPWDQTQRERVKKAVRLLQPPFPVASVEPTAAATSEEPQDEPEGPQYEPDPGFKVTISIEGVEDPLSIEGYDDFLAGATARLSATVDEAGLVELHIRSARLGIDEHHQLASRYPAPGPFSIEASYFIFLRETLGGISRRLAGAMAEQYSGIRVYRDGLRVMPYGERENDWLGLDELSSSRSGVLVPVRNFNWFGQVLISREANPALRDTASREGIVESEAFRQLRDATRAALEQAAVVVAAVRQRKTSTTQPRRPQASRRQILERARDEIASIARTELPPNVATQVTSLVTRALDLPAAEARAADTEQRRQVASLLGELELLRILASLGTSIAVFSHEVRSALNAAAAAFAVLAADYEEDAGPEQLREAHRAITDLTDLAGYIDAYVSLSRRRERTPQPLRAVLREFSGRLSRNLARNIAFEIDVTPENLRTEAMSRSELESALINLLTNSIKAMDAEGGERRVSIRATPEDGQVVIRFQDTGTGIRPELAERIFDPFVTDSSSAISELGTGTGLGLKIVADIAESNGGSISLADPTDPYRTCFELRLPRWSQQTSNE
jgi:signal transduction histidine kinase